VRRSAERRLLLAWLVLVLITLVYLWIDQAADKHGVLVASTGVTVAAIVLALIKARIIMREFMDVRHAPRVLRGLTDLLLVIMAVAMLGAYLVGRAVA
jgi:hypothetical protein